MKKIALCLCLAGVYLANGQSLSIGNYRLLTAQLDTILTNDQKYRLMIEEIEAKHGPESPEMKGLWETIQKNDSLNLIQVTTILDKYGWLGPDAVGERGNSALFFVIQHADLIAQEKYLPLMRQAVKDGKANGSQLAMLEDRVAIRQGRKQIYGSQITRDNQTGKYSISPIEDEPNVNKRRAAVGLIPLEEYAKRWNIEYRVPEK